MDKDMNSNYFQITLSYEIPYNVLNSTNADAVQARENLYKYLESCIPEKYERFSVKLVIYQLQDTFNYLVTYNACFRSIGDLPMSEYVGAREIRDRISQEFENFFNSLDCDYKQINIKTLV